MTKGKSAYSSGEDHGTQRNSVTYRYKRETMAVEEPLLPTATLYPADNDDCEGGVRGIPPPSASAGLNKKKLAEQNGEDMAKGSGSAWAAVLTLLISIPALAGS